MVRDQETKRRGNCLKSGPKNTCTWYFFGPVASQNEHLNSLKFNSIHSEPQQPKLISETALFGSQFRNHIRESLLVPNSPFSQITNRTSRFNPSPYSFAFGMFLWRTASSLASNSLQESFWGSWICPSSNKSQYPAPLTFSTMGKSGHVMQQPGPDLKCIHFLQFMKLF